jgi:hypothetical protein
MIMTESATITLSNGITVTHPAGVTIDDVRADLDRLQRNPATLTTAGDLPENVRRLRTRETS